MAAQTGELFTKPIAASEIGNLLADLVEGLPAPTSGMINISISTSVPSLACHFKLPVEDSLWRGIITAQVAPFSNLTYVAVLSWTVNHPMAVMTYVLEDPLMGKISLKKADGHPLTERSNTLEILAALEKVLPLQMRSSLVSEALPDTQREQLRYQQQILADLQATTAKVTTGIADFTIQAHKALQDRHHELESSFQRRQVELDEAFKKRQLELEAAVQTNESAAMIRLSLREDALVRREEDMRKVKEELDLRDTTTARRANQQQIQAVVSTQSTVKLTEDTTKKRNLVHLLCGLGVLVFGAIAATFLAKIAETSDDRIHWQFAVPFSTGLLGFASTLVFWIKWSDSWFREHARAEFANRKLNADATRAAWLVELLLEWSRDGRDAMPSAVVDSLTKNLFTEVATEAPSHASDPLQRFLKQLASIRVNSDGVELGSKAKVRTSSDLK